MGYRKIARASEVSEGSVHVVHTRAGRIALTRIGDEIVAFEDVCTHDDGPLAGGTLDGEVITCPRHGAQFNVCSGKVLKMPATEDIETFDVRLAGDDVEVDLS